MPLLTHVRFPCGRRIRCRLIHSADRGETFVLHATPNDDSLIRDHLERTEKGRGGCFSKIAKFDAVAEDNTGANHHLIGCFVYEYADNIWLSVDMRRGPRVEIAPSESSLPKWAQRRLYEQRLQIDMLEGLRHAHSVLSDPVRDWFILPGPVEGEESRKLWLLNKDSPMLICDLAPGDVLLVGRAIPKP